MGKKKVSVPVVARNKDALRNFYVLERLEAGIELKGAEVKSIREGRVNLKGSFARVENHQVWVYNIHIAPYSHHDMQTPDPLRRRKLLLHRSEIDTIVDKVSQKGFAIVPLSLYFKKGKAKVEVGLCKGKRLYDKRQKIKEKTVQRDIERTVRDFERRK